MLYFSVLEFALMCKKVTLDILVCAPPTCPAAGQELHITGMKVPVRRAIFGASIDTEE